MTVRRWTQPQVVYGIAVAYWKSNGFKAFEWEIKERIPIRGTTWGLDGSVKTQTRQVDDEGNFLPTEDKYFPPWWWGVQDQTKPTAPWWDHEKNRAKE